MAIPIKQSRYHPKNWHIVTWIWALYWGAWAGLANWPYKIDPKTAFSAYTEIAVKLNLPIATRRNMTHPLQRALPSDRLLRLPQFCA